MLEAFSAACASLRVPGSQPPSSSARRSLLRRSWPPYPVGLPNFRYAHRRASSALSLVRGCHRSCVQDVTPVHERILDPSSHDEGNGEISLLIRHQSTMPPTSPSTRPMAPAIVRHHLVSAINCFFPLGVSSSVRGNAWRFAKLTAHLCRGTGEDTICNSFLAAFMLRTCNALFLT